MNAVNWTSKVSKHYPLDTRIDIVVRDKNGDVSRMCNMIKSSKDLKWHGPHNWYKGDCVTHWCVVNVPSQ